MKSKLFTFLSLVTLLSTTLAHAHFHGDGHEHNISQDCLKKLESLMVTDAEKNLFQTQQKALEFFPVTCEDGFDGVNTIYKSGSVVFVHEAAHFADLGWENGINSNLTNFNLLTASNERIGSAVGYESLPQPQDIFNKYIKENRPELLNEESVFFSIHEGYLLDPMTLAAQNILGLSTELNGYSHGTVMELRNLPNLPDDMELKDPDSGLTFKVPNPHKSQVNQLDGLFYFLFTTNMYLNLINDQDPASFKKFFNDENKIYLKKLFDEAIKTANKVNFCEKASNVLNYGFYVNEFRNLDKSIFKEIVGEESVKTLLCEGYDVLTEDLSPPTDEKAINYDEDESIEVDYETFLKLQELSKKQQAESSEVIKD